MTDDLIDTSKGFNFESLVEGVCICGLRIKVGYTDGQPTVMHPLPMCDTFKRYESPIDYLKHLNDQIDRARAVMQHMAGTPGAPEVTPLFTCTNCRAKVYFQKEPGPCPKCGAPRPN